MTRKKVLRIVQVGVPSQLSLLLRGRAFQIGIADEAFGSDKLDTILWVQSSRSDVLSKLPSDVFVQQTPMDFPVEGYITLHVDVAPGPDHFNEVLKMLERHLGADFRLNDTSSAMHV